MCVFFIDVVWCGLLVDGLIGSVWEWRECVIVVSEYKVLLIFGVCYELGDVLFLCEVLKVGEVCFVILLLEYLIGVFVYIKLFFYWIDVIVK